MPAKIRKAYSPILGCRNKGPVPIPVSTSKNQLVPTATVTALLLPTSLGYYQPRGRTPTWQTINSTAVEAMRI